jgi:acyl-CoA dehydrogenase
MIYFWLAMYVMSFCILSYHRASLNVWTISFSLLVLFATFCSKITSLTWVSWIILLLVFIPLQYKPWRRKLISRPILNTYLKIMPTMSRTEKEALAAGSVTWEGELFCGMPRWNKLLNIPKPVLTAEEQAFLDGPVEELCCLTDDWDITHNRADLPPELWQFIREQGFFGLIIPKEYGGKAFSAYAHSQILAKVYSRSSTVATTIAVPNSLGPAELLLHYGTPKQKSYYLPRLARGVEIPCFALTAPNAGSDAGAITDEGIVCWGEHEGEHVLGIRLNWDKRYITLAPVATVIGLAFKLYDPEHFLGDQTSLGITCALIPRNTPGIIIGRRHFPLNIVFQNGPIQGKDVFIPVDWIIGGPEMAGHGWQMLMECLAAGRAISLPAGSTGGSKKLAFASGAYARIRRQFNLPIGRFEGIAAVLARIAGNTYIIDAARSLAAATIDTGEKPAIASAIVKYHTTELGRVVANDAMDIHGGKGICLGPRNYLARDYQASPIAITVEGANILTRNMIIFGQGAMRCHPHIFAEFDAASQTDKTKQLIDFDHALIGHINYTLSNMVRTLTLSLTGGVFAQTPSGKLKKYFQLATRFSAAFALVADMSLLVLGGALKRKESISGRLGDILSYLYLLSAVLKHHHDQELPPEDDALIEWIMQTCFYQIQMTFAELLQNFPHRWVGRFLKVMIFPFGKSLIKPKDTVSHAVAELLLSPTSTRMRLAAGAFLSPVKENILAVLEDALLKVITSEAVEKTVRASFHAGVIEGNSLAEQALAARAQGVISEVEYEQLVAAEEARSKVIAVDDFMTVDLARNFTFVSNTHAEI